jgi:3-dehydroquinate dehydratase
MSQFRPIELGETVNSREAEIQKLLATLRQQLEAFSYPNPAEYEIEELESWAKSKEQIRDPEKELAETHRAVRLKAANTKYHHLET